MTAGPDPAAGSWALGEARRLADDVLFPAALAVDSGEPVLGSHLDALAENGFYGLAAPEPLATLDLPDYSSVRQVVEILAGGCLTTTFVWMQHHAAVIAATETGNTTLRETYLAALIRGERRAGLAAGAGLRPGQPLLRATAVNGGWIFDGKAPWVTGWGLVDTLYTAGRDDRDVLVWAFLDATESDSIGVEPLDMLAVQASRTVTVRLDHHFVPDQRVTATMPRTIYLESDAESLRFNGSLALGVAGRAISLLADDAGVLAAELEAAREALAEADPSEIPAARAAAAHLALRAAAALTVHDGSRSVLLDGHAQRLIREATFLLVFGSRPSIRTALLERLTNARRTSGI